MLYTDTDLHSMMYASKTESLVKQIAALQSILQFSSLQRVAVTVMQYTK